jgi:hypothetical protein
MTIFSLTEELPSKTSLTLFQLPLQTSESIHSFHHNSTTQPSEKALLLIIHNNDCKSSDNPIHTDTLRFRVQAVSGKSSLKQSSSSSSSTGYRLMQDSSYNSKLRPTTGIRFTKT